MRCIALLTNKQPDIKDHVTTKFYTPEAHERGRFFFHATLTPKYGTLITLKIPHDTVHHSAERKGHSGLRGWQINPCIDIKSLILQTAHLK